MARAVAGVLAGELGAAAGEHLADARGEGRRDLGVLALRLVAGAEVVRAAAMRPAGGRIRRGDRRQAPLTARMVPASSMMAMLAASESSTSTSSDLHPRRPRAGPSASPELPQVAIISPAG